MATAGSNPQFKDIPEQYIFPIWHFVTGIENMTDKELSQPILRPGLYDTYYLFIIQYALLSLLGMVVNIWIVYYIFTHKLYRDASHAFFVNLCICHFVQSAFVLPITLLVIIVQNWILGQFMCYFLPMLQDIPLHAALLTHLLIAWDRMRWLNDPMNSRLPAFVCSCATWLTGMVIALPYPIYTTYLDLGLYLPKFRDVGICAVNLVDDMQEYTRGLFLLMFVAPSVILAYLYIHTSKDLHPPDGELSVMMYEQRADITASRQQRHSTTSSSRSATSRNSYARSYDLYDAEADATREQRTQCFLGSMASCEVACIGPLMVLRFARQQMVETYENSSQFDLTYLMFVWFAFLPTVINPCIYSFWILSEPTKSKIWRYFRLSSRRSDSDNKFGPQQSAENSITQENTTETLDIEAKIPLTQKSGSNAKATNKHHSSAKQPASATTKMKKKSSTIATSTATTLAPTTSAHRTGGKKNLRKELPTNKIRPELRHSIDEVNNSCSNITASTYCNGNGVSTSSGIGLDFESGAHIERKSICDRDSVYSGVSSDRYSHRSQDMLSETGNISARRESSSTYERDMDIIDLLERERSMDIQDMIERERRAERTRKKQAYARTSASVERHRKLPDITKIAATPNSPKRTISTEQSTNFPNFVFTHQYNEFAEARTNRNRDLNAAAVTSGSRHNSQGSFGKRSSDAHQGDDEEAVNVSRTARKLSVDSRKGSTKSIRDSRVLSSGKYADTSHANKL